MQASITLKPGREDPLLRRHPWLFSGAVARVEGDPEPGETVEIISSEGEWIARGAYSPHSQIRVRIWTWDHDQAVDPMFISRRIGGAIERRAELWQSEEVDAYREVHAESDGFPGLIVDRYVDIRVIQVLSTGAERWREPIVEALAQQGDCEGIYERSDVDVRELEGLSPRSGLVWGRQPPEELLVREGDLQYLVDIRQGHKTGFYLDQRENRSSVRKWVMGGSVLDAFCYTGGFALNAYRGGAGEIIAIDSSDQALDHAARNAAQNQVHTGSIEWRQADVFSELRSLRDQGRSFDVIILDPPRFAPTAAQVHRASRGYKDINLMAFKLLSPGGRLITFSCSGGVSAELFQKIVADAAIDAQVDVQIREWLGQPADHPVATSFPEGRYLKGLVCTVGEKNGRW